MANHTATRISLPPRTLKAAYNATPNLHAGVSVSVPVRETVGLLVPAKRRKV